MNQLTRRQLIAASAAAATLGLPALARAQGRTLRILVAFRPVAAPTPSRGCSARRSRPSSAAPRWWWKTRPAPAASWRRRR